ncbi:BON domain-containing protein [Ramlibacter sp.]|uniref:BON domain-containing protein n=1 Tax=Ramlibacter sp. TaxID=1917967 RepID=UPI002D45D2CA|nr:BON domain-containing protein [Ramlibacter sp.]HYD75224.1 BON domain-containing protein [Ramlibacter sp.]
MTHALLRFAATTFAAATLAATLTACAPLVLGGAAVGTLVALDRRTSGAQLEDEGIELRAAARIREAMGERAHVNVSSYNRQVLLTGEVPTDRDKQQAELIVSKVENVKGIYNELGVMGNSSLTQRSSDTLITGKVKASLVDDRELSANAFRVVTERGTVYLMGRVTQREADKATQIARSVGGVQRVVRLFELISEQELQQIAPQATAQPAAPAR